MFIQGLLQRGALPHALGSLVTEYFRHAVLPAIKSQDEITARDRASAFVQNKVKFEVRRSRNLLMIPDETGVLKKDEVFIQCSPLESTIWPAEPGRVITGNVVVYRSPTYHGKHILVLKAVGAANTDHGKKVLSALDHLHDGKPIA